MVFMDAPADRGKISEANKPLAVRVSGIDDWLACQRFSKWRQFNLLARPRCRQRYKTFGAIAARFPFL
ncbi:hypothetical protein ACLK1T_13535 [Escherichia coli]